MGDLHKHFECMPGNIEIEIAKFIPCQKSDSCFSPPPRKPSYCIMCVCFLYICERFEELTIAKSFSGDQPPVQGY